MLVTRETDYAIRAIRALSDGKQKTLSQICKEEYVPEQFGYKILKKLAKAGYVNIKRGKTGGYTIADNFAKLSLYDITVVMENPTDISPCVVPGYRCEVHVNKDEPCAVNECLSSMQKVLDAELKAINMKTLFAK